MHFELNNFYTKCYCFIITWININMQHFWGKKKGEIMKIELIETVEMKESKK